MNSRTVEITQILRQMRGRSKGHLIKANDGNFYVAKFVGNPQGNRTLINEWIMGHLLQELQVATPPLVLLRLGDETETCNLLPQISDSEPALKAGVHLGSRCPADPTRTTLFDFLPTALLHRVQNIKDFIRVLALDTLVNQKDNRQAVFVRDHPGRGASFQVSFIDHGSAFGGVAWTFQNDVSEGLYYNRHVYSLLDCETTGETALENLNLVNQELLDETISRIPDEWLAPEDDSALRGLTNQVLRRRSTVRVLFQEKLRRLEKW